MSFFDYNYNYEKGAYSTIRFDWDNAAKKLTIGTREGNFPGMLKNRKFRVTLVDKNTKSGHIPAKATRTVSYNGKATTVRF